MPYLVVVAAIVGFFLFWFRHLWARAVLEWLRDVSSPVLVPPRNRSLGALQRVILRKVRSTLPIGVSGRIAVPVRFLVRLHPSDLDRVLMAPAMFNEDLGGALLETAAESDWTITGTPVFEYAANPQGTLGRPRVEVLRAAPEGTTRRGATPFTGGTLPSAGGRTVEIGKTVPHAVRRICQLVSLDEGHVSIDVATSLVIGRGVSGIGRLESPGVSGTHAEVAFAEDCWTLTDLESTNGTWVNGRRVEHVELIEGDEVEFGIDGPRFLFTVRASTADRVRE